MAKHLHHRGLLAVGLVAAIAAGLLGAVFSAPDVAGSTPAIPPLRVAYISPLMRARQSLEIDLEDRSVRLTALSKDLSVSTTLTSAHADLLRARIASDSSAIQTLLVKVPTDASLSMVTADRSSMRRDYRIFAVLSPQVFETVDADATVAQASALNDETTTLLSEVSALVGTSGYKSARSHYESFQQHLDGLVPDVTKVVANELAATPHGYPANAGLLSSANQTIVKAAVDVADASSDATVISLDAGTSDS